MDKIPSKIFVNKSSRLIVGEVANTLRAQGNITSTGDKIDSSTNSPIVDGVYGIIPHMSIGIMDYSDLYNATQDFNEDPSGTNNSSEHPWNSIGAVSLDGIFCPYTTMADAGRSGPWLPRFTEAASGVSGPSSKTLNPFNPFNNLSGISSTGHSVNSDPWMSGGHNISTALNYNPYDSGVTGSGGFVGISGVYPSGSGAPIDIFFEKDHFVRHTVETEGIRAVGLKGPLVLTGWGYDTDGKPVPSGNGIINGVAGIHPEATWNPATWKSGPVDLRWDEARGVWTGGNTTKIYLVKLTNLYTPPSFSFEVDRSNSRDQYSRSAPQSMRAFDSSEAIYDPEYLAYTANDDNKNYYEQLDYTGLEFPFYEAFIIRETKDSVGQDYYNIWTNDCQDCGHITNSGCGTQHGSDSTGKKVLIENPLRQAFDVGDLAFTVDTGRKKNVNTGSFIGGSGENAAGQIVIDASGSGSFEVTSSGSGYIYGGFALYSGCDICTNLDLVFSGGKLLSGTLDPNTGLTNYDSTCVVQIYPNNATAETESLPIHWVTQAEFKSQQVVTHVECDNGTLQSCTLKLQTQGYKTCEWCGEDTALINN